MFLILDIDSFCCKVVDLSVFNFLPDQMEKTRWNSLSFD